MTELAAIAPADAAAFAPWRRAQFYRGKPVGVPACNRDLAALKALFSWALATERLVRNPTVHVHLAPEHQGTREIVIVEGADFEAALGQLRTRWADAAVGMLGTGMRWSSLARLARGDMDAVRRAVILRRPKGKRAIELVVSERCFAALGRVCGRLADGAGGFDGAVGKACARAGVRRWTAHMLRHTFAVACVRKGADLRSVQEWMGHASIKTTEKYLRFAKAGPPPAPV